MTRSQFVSVNRALISVADKSGITEFANALHNLHVNILATGNTYNLLTSNQIPASEVSDYTGFPEIMDGRVKTLHPKIHGGILARRGIDDSVLINQAIQPIDLIVVNLYPFEQTINKPNCQLTDAIENIDIGGPAMLRAAAKNHQHVCVVVDPNDYNTVIQELQANQGKLGIKLRQQLACKAFTLTARYDQMIADYLTKQYTDLLTKKETESLPNKLTIQFDKITDLRYGENPHQQAALYQSNTASQISLASAQQLQGKPLSYNNLADSQTALSCVKVFKEPACVIVKHANPCGIALATDLTHAYERAYTTDPTSAFGGVIAFNRELDESTVQAIIDRQFVEVIIAPAISNTAATLLTDKKNLRVLIIGDWQNEPLTKPTFEFKQIDGGLLVQEIDQQTVNTNDLSIVTQQAPTGEQVDDLIFAWHIVKFVKSNAIVLVKNKQAIGIGAGQTSRIDSTKIAIMKAKAAGFSTQDAILASDAFFPFSDNVEVASDAGISAIIQPGGSIRDAEIIDAADKTNLSMVFTGMRHFNH